MKRIEVFSDRRYDILIGANWRDELAKIREVHEELLVIIPESFDSQFNIQGVEKFLVPSGESQKDIAIATKIWDRLGQLQLGRKGAIIGIGGGATTDLAGFVAATWLRGVDWYAFPTSLAAMVDASIGGKTGINTAAGKNLVGAFYSPAKVVIDLAFLETLSDRDFSAGLAEVIKTGLIADESILTSLDKVVSISEARGIALELVEKSARVKASVVSEDFKEGKLREILNFGHTFGHAVEKVKNYELRHGEAVSIGLIFALRLSEELSGLDSAVTRDMEAMLRKFNLPIEVEDFGWQKALLLMQGDKKSRGNQLRFIGIDKIGHPVWLESVPTDLAERIYEMMHS